jgi:hypothetical protein
VTSVQHGSAVKWACPVGYTHRAVAHYRLNSVVRAVAFILSLWLGLDLAAAGSCCQDEPMHGATESSWVTDCTGSESPTEPTQADTCFCCALVVGPAVVQIPPPRQDALVIPDVDLSDRPGIRPVLYHPPLVRS